ncbi:MAG: hypothetical protein GXY33_03210 [Phycisphaerae bacterium]|nr:hypothetical protein [Phycisphaerae bacterium]
MPEWSEQLERQLASALARCAPQVRFDGRDAGALWLWQAKRKAALNEALGLDVPTVYGPPKATLVKGQEKAVDQFQVWSVETEPGVALQVHMRAVAALAGRPGAIVINLADRFDPAEHETFCGRINAMGLTAVSLTPRGLHDNSVWSLAAAYLGLGQSYAGVAVSDLLRVVDHIESLLEVESEPLIVLGSGWLVPVVLAFAALDQRITGLVIGFGDGETLGGPTDRPPLFMNAYMHLGPNPVLTLAQCVVPKPMLLSNFPERSVGWLTNGKSGVLAPTEQLKQLTETYHVAGHPDRLELTGTAAGPDERLEQLRHFLEDHFTTID